MMAAAVRALLSKGGPGGNVPGGGMGGPRGAAEGEPDKAGKESRGAGIGGAACATEFEAAV